MVQLQIDTTTDSVLNTRGPEWAYYQKSQALFGGDEIVVIAIPGEISFDEAMLAKVDQLTGILEQLESNRPWSGFGSQYVSWLRQQYESHLKASGVSVQ